MGHSAAKIKSVGSPKLERLGNSSFGIQLRRSQLHGLFAACAGRASRGNPLPFELQRRAVSVGCNLYALEGSRLERHLGRLLDFSKNFVQSVVREFAL